MGFTDKFKNMFNMSEEEFLDDVEFDDEEMEDDAPSSSRNEFSFGRTRERESKIVDIHSANPTSKTNVVFQKLDNFEDVGSVADHLNEKRIVILNLESCPKETTVRILDFLSGVSYANHGDIKRIAGRAYVAIPYNVPLSGELLDEVEKAQF